MSERLFIGAMSGTSADGVDAALVAIDGRGLSMTARLLHHCHKAYDPTLRRAIFEIRSTAKADLTVLAKLGRDISLVYAKAVADVLSATNVTADQITAIAAHGQTLFHDPPLTIQWFDPSLLAWETGCAVVSDFRRADCAAGGQGAPLVPFADYVLFRHPTKNRVLLNIGGIANLTYLRAGGTIDEVIAFDTGPGNCISDWICRRFFPDGKGYDDGGKLAMAGRAMGMICDNMLADPYFAKPPPKSTDGPAMLALWDKAVEKLYVRNSEYRLLTPMDLLASSCLVTATAIYDAMARLLPVRPDNLHELLVSGGGMQNEKTMLHLDILLTGGRIGFGAMFEGTQIMSTSDAGWASEAKEAVAFALLGAATIDGIPSNVPSVTGASRGVVLGSMTPPSVQIVSK